MCINCLCEEEKVRLVRYHALKGEWIHVWDLKKSRRKTEEELFSEMRKAIDPKDFDMTLAEGEEYFPFGIDLQYYAIAIMKKAGE